MSLKLHILARRGLLKVPKEPSQMVNFRNLLLNRCQTEFERGLDVEIIEKKNIELVTGSEEQEQCLKEELQQRMVGIGKFIGELFKVKMLTEAIMHDCIGKMLKAHSEESLVCLCVMLSVTGKDLDLDKTKPRMDHYFNNINVIIKERQTSNRIRFMLQDVIDLRRLIPPLAPPAATPSIPPAILPPLLLPKVEPPAEPTLLLPRIAPPAEPTLLLPRVEPPAEPALLLPRVEPPAEPTLLPVEPPAEPTLLLPRVEPPAEPTLLLPRVEPPAEPTLLPRVEPPAEPILLLPRVAPPAEPTLPLPRVAPPAEPTLLLPRVAAPAAVTAPPPSAPAAPPAAAAPGAAGVWSVSPLEDDLSCPVCCDIYTDPVVLPCSHSFCRPCLERSWREKCVRQECLICRQKTTAHNPTPNLALRNVCEAYLKERSAGTPPTESDFNNTETHLVQALCPEHGEKLQFYCQDEDQLVCVECVTQEHKTHAVCSAKKAAHERKDELKCLIKSLEDDVKKNKTLIEGVMSHIKAQAAQTETQIKEEFEKLHQFLRREEEARIAALREEERDKTANLEEKMEAIERVISSLSERMKPIEKLMETDEVSFLQTFSESKERTQEAFLHPHPGFWMLLDVSKYLDKLSYRVWDRMKEMVAHSAVTVGSDTLQFHPVISAPEHLECFAAGLETSGIWNAGGVSGQARVDHNSF
ncbi:uncharacterized protein LOC143117784 [Alosa pseudoharengus]|uniref:uncharacterized protein LOC143117784 n=1 Tax=Alosa pseudoharengus TaxID=34774 RepID=UPI003F895055